MKQSYGSACADIQTNHRIWIIFSMVLTQGKSYGIKCPRGPSVLHTETSENMTVQVFHLYHLKLRNVLIWCHVHKCHQFQGTLPLHLLSGWSPQQEILFKSVKILQTKDLYCKIIDHSGNGRLLTACLDQLGMHSPLSEKKIHLISNQSNLHVHPKGWTGDL
jgi:hypothetical protein